MTEPKDALGRIGAFRVLKRLATGGTSDVLLARAEGPHGFERTVVLKRLLTAHEDDAEFAKMFAREAAAYARLGHPAIVKLFDFFEHDGQLVMVLEHIDGVSLARLLNYRVALGTPLADASSLWIASRVFDGLSAAHTARDPETGEFSVVIHRDVNPSNVLVPWDGYVKLADFGIAKIAGFDAETATGVLKGTYGYMAPEQVRGERVTIRTDVYAAAVVLWELLTHRRAFPNAEKTPEMELLRAMAEPKLPPIDELRPDLPAALRDALRRALEPNPDRRHVTAEEMLGVLADCGDLERGRLALVSALRPLKPRERESSPPTVTVQARSEPAPAPNPLDGDTLSDSDLVSLSEVVLGKRDEDDTIASDADSTGELLPSPKAPRAPAPPPPSARPATPPPLPPSPAPPAAAALKRQTPSSVRPIHVAATAQAPRPNPLNKATMVGGFTPTPIGKDAAPEDLASTLVKPPTNPPMVSPVAARVQVGESTKPLPTHTPTPAPVAPPPMPPPPAPLDVTLALAPAPAPLAPAPVAPAPPAPAPNLGATLPIGQDPLRPPPAPLDPLRPASAPAFAVPAAAAPFAPPAPPFASPQSPFASQPAPPFASQPAPPFASQPAPPFASQPAPPFASQPAPPFASQPAPPAPFPPAAGLAPMALPNMYDPNDRRGRPWAVAAIVLVGALVIGVALGYVWWRRGHADDGVATPTPSATSTVSTAPTPATSTPSTTTATPSTPSTTTPSTATPSTTPTATSPIPSTSASAPIASSAAPTTSAAPATSSAPSAKPAPSTTAPIATASAAETGVAPNMGVLKLPARAAGHRIYVDDKVVGHDATPITLSCGKHTVKVGSADKPRELTVPCGGSIDVP